MPAPGDLSHANDVRLARAQIKRRLKTATIDFRVALESPEMRGVGLLEVLGYALIGHCAKGRHVGPLALEIAAGMPFSVTHFTRVGDIADADRLRVYWALLAVVSGELEPAATSSSASS